MGELKILNTGKSAVWVPKVELPLSDGSWARNDKLDEDMQISFEHTYASPAEHDRYETASLDNDRDVVTKRKYKPCFKEHLTGVNGLEESFGITDYQSLLAEGRNPLIKKLTQGLYLRIVGAFNDKDEDSEEEETPTS